jgi:hypothetical protein
VTGVLVVALALLGTIAPGLASPPAVTWEDDTVTATFEGVPVDEAVAALARAAGVEVRGAVQEQGDIHARFERARFPEVLDRLLGEQNFTITYDAAGRPRRVELLGMPGVSEPPAWRGTPGGFGNVVTGYGRWACRRSWPTRSVGSAPIWGGAPAKRAPPGPRHRRGGRRPVRPHGRRRARLHDALLRTDDAKVTRVLRMWFGPGTERLLGALAEETHDPLLRSKALRLEQQLRVGQPAADGPAT